MEGAARVVRSLRQRRLGAPMQAALQRRVADAAGGGAQPRNGSKVVEQADRAQVQPASGPAAEPFAGLLHFGKLRMQPPVLVEEALELGGVVVVGGAGQRLLDARAGRAVLQRRVRGVIDVRHVGLRFARKTVEQWRFFGDGRSLRAAGRAAV